MAKVKLKINTDQHLQLFYDVIAELHKVPSNKWQRLADDAEVSLATLYKWFNYEVRCPHLRTVFNVAWAMGFEVVLQKRGVTLSKSHLKVVK